MKKLKILIIDRKIRKYIPDVEMDMVLQEMKKIVDFEAKWILVNPEPDEKNITDLRNFNFREFEDYKTDNILEILDVENPDMILISNDYDYFIRSFIPCAKAKKIPIILLLYYLTGPREYLDSINFEEAISKISLHKERIGEIFAKFRFMINTFRRVNVGFHTIIKIFFKEIFVIFTKYNPQGEYGADYVFVSGKDWKKRLQQKNVTSSIEIVGTSKMDILFNQIPKLESHKQNEKEINIVLLTTPLVEHGLQSIKNWKETIKQIIIFCKNQKQTKINLVLKIHPTSESKTKYEKIMDEMDIKIPIYQRENLIEIIWKNDIVMTYGFSSATLEALLLNKPVINVNLFGYPKEKMPFVQAGLSYELKSFSDFNLFDKTKFDIDKKKLDEYIERNYYKFDGKSSERIANKLFFIANSGIKN